MEPDKYSAEYTISELVRMWYLSHEDINNCLKDWYTKEDIILKIQEILLED